MDSKQRKKIPLSKRQKLMGWLFLAPGALLLLGMSFVPIFKALWMSFQTGIGTSMKFSGIMNYTRMFKDSVFIETLTNTLFYLIQIPIILIFALILASLLNKRGLRLKGFFRTCIFLPCATSLVSYSLVFKSLFAADGLINLILVNMGILSAPYDFLGNPLSARIVIIIAMVWRWTGYNMVFYLAGLQNIEYSVYEAARIDGASFMQQFRKITIPLLKPTILLTAIMSVNGVLQLFDESVNLTNGGPGNATLSMSHYIYNIAFEYVPNFGYATALSFFIMLLVAIAAFVQMKVGDKRD